jgi:hypothetical protein
MKVEKWVWSHSLIGGRFDVRNDAVMPPAVPATAQHGRVRPDWGILRRDGRDCRRGSGSRAFSSHVVNPTLGLEQIEANVGTTNSSMAAMSVAWLRRKVRHPCDGGPHRALSSAYQGSSHSEGRSGPL